MKPLLVAGIVLMAAFVSHSQRVLSHSSPAEVSAHWQSSSDLKILTLNVGALAPFGKITSPQAVKRLKKICQKLEQSDYDVVFLQEVWTQGYRKLFKKCGYPYALESEKEAGLISKLKRGEVSIKKLKLIARSFKLLFPSRYGFDTGLMILSRYPLSQIAMRRFAINGVEERSFSDGEFPVNKGVLGATLSHPVLGNVFLANTHLVSEYQNYSYNDQRESQLEEIMEFLGDHSHQLPVVLGGDFNMSPPGVNDEERGFGTDRLWRRLRSSLLQEFIQADLPYDMLTTFPAQGGTPDLGVLDHLFTRGNLRPISGGVVLNNGYRCKKNSRCSFSDHFGLETTFRQL